MSHFFQKPENALKRAKELMSIPNVDEAVLKRTKRAALEILHDALVAKKHRTWQPMHEELMILYLDICLDLQVGRIAKDGLHQYRNLSIQHNPASLDTVIRHFVTQTELKLAEAKRQSSDLIIQAAASVDLEAAQTPEAVMLSTTSFDSSSDRTDREVVVPWLRFTWETYRTVLDILKNNSKLELLYKTVTMQAFTFCEDYIRKIEFRRLCEILRNHLGALQKHSSAPTSQSVRQMRSWEGFTLESVELLLEVRYRQLQVATSLELYSEAFRTIDDINTIMSLVDQVPRLELLVTYYEKLAQIFLVSQNQLYHAYALYKWYALRVSGLGGMDGAHAIASLPSLVSAPEQESMATQVVLAALSVPLVDFEATSVLDHTLEETSVTSTSSFSLSVAAREKSLRMAALLGYNKTPTRQQLLEELSTAGILQKTIPSVSTLYQLMEKQEIDPLQIVKKVTPLLETIRARSLHEATYAESLERLLVRRVLFQLTRVYSSVTISHLKSLFDGLHVTYPEIEQLIVRSRSLSTVAHSSAPSLSSMYMRPDGRQTDSSIATSSLLRTTIRIDHVQQCIRFSDALELEANPAQLTLLGDRLTRVLASTQTTQTRTQLQAQRKALFEQTRAELETTRTSMLARKEVIERKKEELEQLQVEKLKTLEQKRIDAERQRLQLEQARLEQDAKRRELEKKQKIKDEIALKETRTLLDKLGHTNLDEIDLETIDRDQLVQEAKEKALKLKEEAQRKLKESARRLDYIIRATREAEQPIIQRMMEEEKSRAKLQYEQDQVDQLEAATQAHARALSEQTRLEVARTVTNTFVTNHHTRRLALYQQQALANQQRKKLERLEQRVLHAKARYEEEQVRLREEEAERQRILREKEAACERERQAEIEEERRRREVEEAEEARQRQVREEEASAKPRDKFDRFSSRDDRYSNERFGFSSSSSSRRGGDDGEWTSVGSSRSASRTVAPEGRWGRSAEERPRFSDREDRREPSNRFSSDREGGSSSSGLRNAFGGAEPRRYGGGDSRYGGGDSRYCGGDSRYGGGDRRDREPFGSGRSDVRSSTHEGGDDRFFKRGDGDNVYRPPRGDRDARPPSRAPEGGSRW